MKMWIWLVPGFLLMSLLAHAVDYELVTGKVLKNAELLSVTNNLYRVLHDEDDNVYLFKYFTRSSKRAIKKATINHELLKKIEAEEEAEKKRKTAHLRAQFTNELAPPFPVVLSEIKYLGGNVASLTISNALATNVVVQIIAGRIVQQTLVLKPLKVKKRVMFRYHRREKVLIKANDKQKEIKVRINL